MFTIRIIYSWICSRDLVTWNRITSFETFKTSLGKIMNEDQLFDEIGQLKLYLIIEKNYIN